MPRLTIRVIVVDDSEIASRRLTRILEAAPDIRVVRSFAGADELTASALSTAGTVVLMDLWMPGTSGMGALKGLVGRAPVVIVSDVDAGSALAQEALAQGASAFVSKKDLADEAGQERLRKTVRRMATGGTEPFLPVVAIVGSTGAPRALERLVPELRDSPAATLFLQHLAPQGVSSFAHWLTTLGVPTVPARSGARLIRGQGLLAPAGQHMLVHESNTVRFASGDPGELHVPSGNRLLSSATFLGRRLLVVVLSGMGDDGASGVAAVAKHGARCIVQAPADCAVDSMPRAAMEAFSGVRVIPLDSLGSSVRETLRRA